MIEQEPKSVIPYRRPSQGPRGVPGRYIGTVIVAVIVLAIGGFFVWRGVESRRVAREAERARIESEESTKRYEESMKRAQESVLEYERKAAEQRAELERQRDGK